VTSARTEFASLTEDPASAAHFERDVIPLLEPLRGRAIQITSTIADAEDLLQETLLKAYAGRRSF
jgi:RNA polymerase sigma-70 factor (ECF subfamily)